ncbi:nesprin-3 isoform X1 [Oryzias melastigma]|nr:nesprin-3 isoform X1 [Oryzias melastigma]XP_036065843.1 nesprin-3 isoform X1 [Oryzias melastigma]
MTQQEQQQFAESLEAALSWIQDVQERVNANDSTLGPLDALKVRLDETKKIYQSKHEGQMKMADAQTAAQILLESEDEELHKRTNAKLKELKSMWDETEQSITHCHSRIEWVWLRWREYLKIYEEFELWLEKQRCYLDVDVEQQVGAKEKLWQVDQQRVVLSDVRAKVAVLERLLEEAATLYSTTQDPSVDSQTQERLQESYHDIKSRSEERLALLQRISDEHYQYQDYVDKFQAFLLSKTKELNQLMPPEEPTDGKVKTLKALDYSVACEEKTLKYIEVIADGIKANTSPAGAEVVQEEAEELRLGWQRLRQELFEAGEAFGCSLDSHSLDSPNLDSPNLVRDNLVPNELNSNSQDSSNLVVYRLDSPNLVPDKLNSNSRDSANPVLFKFDSQSLDSPNPDSLDPIPHKADSHSQDSPNLILDKLNSNIQDSANPVLYKLDSQSLDSPNPDSLDPIPYKADSHSQDSPKLVLNKLNSNIQDSANPVLYKLDSQSLDSPNPDSLDPIPYKADSHSQDSPNLVLNKLNSNIQDSANPVPYKLDSQSLDSPNPDSLDPIPYKVDSHSQDSPKLVLNKLNSNIQDSANPVLYKLDSQSQDSSNLVPHEVDSPNPDLHSMKSQNDYNDRNQQLELDILRLKVLLHDLETKLNNPPFYSHNYEDQMLGRWRTFEDTRKQLEEQESHVENLKAQYDDLLKRSANSHFLSEEMVAVDTELQRMKSRATELCFKSQTRVEELLQESLQEYANWSLRASKALEKSAGVNDSSLIEDPIIEINVLLNERYDLNNRLSALEQTGDQFESIFEPEKANDMLVKLRDAIQQQELLDNQMVQEKERMRGLILGTKDFDVGYKKVEAKIASFRERLEEADTPQTDVFAIQKQSKDIRALMKDLEDFWDHFLALDLLVSTSEENRNLYDGLVESWQVLQGEAEAKRYEKSVAISNHKDFLKVKMGKEYYEEMIKKTEARNRSLQRSKLVNRVCRVALPLWLLLLTLLLLACFLLPFVDESNSCSLTNNFARSFNVMLRYHGPPPT